ncbi:autophagy-related protein 13 [Eucalyptus grandis]|uniref:Uncharacterized protein n=2 Tax=Eucalyptus grandis TaxID=71139 RepID=A0ACC3KHR7_EUCGR|nr:autophagy-related protein 13 [Eucalyptus grandis]KAK3425987.1 hypothetical protein EUGRSUZ_F02525 [Eucalyptus grandis]
MGSCFSKCRPQRRRPSPQEPPLDPSCCSSNLVQDKLVISQHPPPPPPKTPLAHPSRISPSPHSPSKSSCSSSATFSSSSSFAAGAKPCSVSSSSLSSTASSALSSKDRSFSNDFLWSCAKENPHILQINSLKVNSLLSLADKFPDVELGSPAKPRLAAPARRAAPSNSAQKRTRASSPNLTRQKSFRADQSNGSLPSGTHSLPRRTLRSPSPSRRFDGGEKCRGILVNTVPDDGGSKRLVATSKVSAPSNYVGANSRRENVVRPPSPSPNNNPNRPIRPGLVHSETLLSRQIGPKVGEIEQRVLADHDDMMDAVEDLNNPLISLDCFIFL